ncbi:hypothetical protein CBS101457_002054 [Exobasidium rhododendri]|nr:hypothetical protein CBS101457_002054 [Exobasidium rhododendri]
MLPGLSNVLRRDKERQRAAAAGLDSMSPTQISNHHYSVSSQSSSSRQQTPTQQTHSSTASRAPSYYGMLPEEHRAKEKEREKLAKAQLGNAHTQQMMANRQMQQNVTPPAQQRQLDAGQQSRHMESSVTRLLVATKMLLESLTKWSLGQKTETQVSDIYVRLGNDFNVANVAFGSYGIDMRDLASVPDDLRICLERCLSEDPSPQTLEVHLPRIREIIIGLLQGLKGKQAEYKQYLVQSRASARHSKTRNERVGTSEELQQITPAQASQNSAASAITSDAIKRASSVGTGLQQQSPDSEVVRRSILLQSGKRPVQAPALETVANKNVIPANHVSTENGLPPRKYSTSLLRNDSGNGNDSDTNIAKSTARRVDGKSMSKPSKIEDDDDDEKNIDEDVAPGSGEKDDYSTLPRADQIKDSDSTGQQLTDEGVVEEDTVTRTLPASASYSTPSRRDHSRALSGNITHSAPRQGNHLPVEGYGEMGDAADPSVRALKSRDALERRASKRFSAYTFNKMGVGLNQGMGMSSFALGGVSGSASNSALSSPLTDRRDGGSSRLGSNTRRGLVRASSETPTSESSRDYFLPSSIRKTSHKGRGLSSEDVMEEVKGADELPDTPSKIVGSAKRTSNRPSPSQSPRGGNLLKLALPTPSNQVSTARSSTESLLFVDAHNETLQSPQSETQEIVEEILPVPSMIQYGKEQQPPVPPLPTSKELERSKLARNNLPSSSLDSRYLGTSPSNTDVNTATHLPSTGSIVTDLQRHTINGNANSMSLFLQLGRQTRKATIDIDHGAPVKGLTIGKLRMLFMDKFAYSPGKDDFPTIYVKDPASGVTYEVEDLDDVGEGSVLTLNIEPLDQVKQHLDLSLSAITREIRELKAAVHDNGKEMHKQLSTNNHSSAADLATTAASPPTTLKISDAQFALAGAKVAQFKQETTLSNREASSTPTLAQSPKSVCTPTGRGSHGSGWKVAGDQIKQQYNEVQTLRRHMAIITQIQSDFKSDVSGLLGTLREQTTKVRSIAASEVPTERNFIIAGKSRLDASSQEVLTLVEDLLDLVDDLKADVIQRGVKPKPNTMKKLHSDISRATVGLEDLSNYVETVKPSWKKTWELELQNIVDEQEFLNHQEGLISDLKEDHYSLQEVFANIQEVVKLRGANKFTLTGATGTSNGTDNFLGGVALKTYIPPAPEEGHEGLSTVMMEVKSQAVNHDKRLKALQAAERQRLKELDQRKGQEDDFQNELTTFVDGKILRKTGGYIEAERVRSRRDKLTIQAMFSGGTNTVGGAPIDVKTPPPPRQSSESSDEAPSSE